MASALDFSRNYSYLAIAGFFGFLAFMLQPTAYTWGEQDMMPFFERIFDKNYLPNDFFTNTTVVKNPRWVYGYIIVALSWISGLSWYKTLYILKLFLSILNPILYYKVSYALVRNYVDKSKLSVLAPIILGAVVLMVFLEGYREFFTIASWLNYTQAIQANSLSLVFCLSAILLKENGARSIFYLLFFLAGCLIHPTVGFFGALFYILFLIPEYKKEGKNILKIALSCILGMAFIKVIFSSDSSLSTSEFINYYVLERHPWHYHVPYYKIYIENWMSFFVKINFLFLIPLCYGIIKKNKKLILLAALSLFFYAGAITIQYVFIDLYPVKMIAYLGVSRFTSFGYWMLLPLWGILLADFIGENRHFIFPNLNLKNFRLIIINLIFVGIVFLDNPKEDRYRKKKDFYDFVSSTPKDAIFITYSTKLNTDLRIIGRRGVLVGLEFPFTEMAIKEFSNRFSSVYGSRQKELNGTYFYRNLGAKDFLEIAKNYQLDYIVTEKSVGSPFGANIPVWNNNEYQIYKVKNLRL
ncbi:hypothetical protein [Eudoraea adriatica]|uniref:hypothetical protein n=1 Tax=Eudoraea adriatica TaxID=446681 RepID=UPI00035E0E46|nr:hypothetical protein [Eudoraea adriatica]